MYNTLEREVIIMFVWFISLNATDKIALFALVVALYGAILSTILYNKEKFNLKFINLGINCL